MKTKFNYKFFNEKVKLRVKIFHTTKRKIAEALGIKPLKFLLLQLGLAQPTQTELHTIAVYFQREETEFLRKA